jgi:aminoglycoside 6-adenylyltransferase
MDDLLRRLVAFAEGDENVRAVLLEGSRADPDGAIDEWSDYDVAFVTRSNEPYLGRSGPPVSSRSSERSP